ncbi:MAG: ABC transporter permease [Acidobacteriia bacterium]|nr:ABC transporter permease [Terriglobia bacterium]
MRIQHVLRRLARSPLFTAITAITLAVGIGANGAIFSVLNGILLKPLPYAQPDRLIAVNHTAPGVNFPNVGAAPFQYFTYRDEERSFEDVALWQHNTGSVTGLAEPEEAPCVMVTAGALPLLGIRPAIGRWFSEADDSSGAAETIVLMHGWWQTRLGGDRGVIGRKIMVDGVPREVIGIMPADFRFMDEHPAFLLPFRFDRSKTFVGNFSYQMIGRLKPGMTIDQASADVARMIPISLDKFPPVPGFSKKMFQDARLGPKLVLLKDDIVGDVGRTLWVLMGTIGIVLLIACANVANLLLVRAEGRQQELAIRAALGAGWGRIARELLLESVVLGLLGGVLGLALAAVAVRTLTSLAPANLPRLNEISIDPAVVIFTLAVSIFAGLLFGLVPAMKYAAPHIAGALRSGGRALSASKERHRARSVLVVVQVALALVLLIGSGLMIRTFQALRRVDPGFRDPQQILTVSIGIPRSQVKDPEAVARLEKGILDKLAAIPGVASAALQSAVPMDGSGWRDPVYARDKAYSSSLPPLRRFKLISPGLFGTMGIRLAAGRDITWTDVFERRPVAMVSENLARELWQTPDQAIGKEIRESTTGLWRQVVGVAADDREDGVQQKASTIAYFPMLMTAFAGDETFVARSMAYTIRTPRAGTPGLLAGVQQAVWSMNPNLPLANVRTLEQFYEKSLARTSFTLVMLAIAGGMAMLIGLVGIYGVISYSVSQRTREIGIRMALGARQGELTRMFIRHGFTLVAIGIGCGIVAAIGVTRVLSSLLFDVDPLDPLTYLLVSLGLTAAAVLASYIPALRAVSVDPVQALRSE